MKEPTRILSSTGAREAAKSPPVSISPSDLVKKVKTIMRTPVTDISPRAPIRKAVKTMVEKDIGRLPVTENEKLIGIVNRINMVESYLKR